MRQMSWPFTWSMRIRRRLAPRVPDVVLEQCVEPVDVAVGVGGFDLGVIVVQADRCAVVGHSDQQGSALIVEHAGNRLDHDCFHPLVAALLLHVPSGGLLVLDGS